MYVNIHAADEFAESPGKNTKAWNDGDVTFKQVELQSGEPGMEIGFSCTEQFGTGDRSYDYESVRSIRRTVSLWLDPKDVAVLAAALVKWSGPAIPHDTAINLIEKLAKDLRASSLTPGTRNGEKP